MVPENRVASSRLGSTIFRAVCDCKHRILRPARLHIRLQDGEVRHCLCSIPLPSMAFACFAFAGIAFAGIALASIALASMMMMLLRANDVMIHFPRITEPLSKSDA